MSQAERKAIFSKLDYSGVYTPTVVRDAPGAIRGLCRESIQPRRTSVGTEPPLPRDSSTEPVCWAPSSLDKILILDSAKLTNSFEVSITIVRSQVSSIGY